jgi:hypothetical protein
MVMQHIYGSWNAVLAVRITGVAATGVSPVAEAGFVRVF